MHRLSSHDIYSKPPVAECEECGVVRIVFRKDGRDRSRWRCFQAARNSNKSRHHGLTYDEMSSLKDQAGNRCQICGYPDNLRIDHDHTTEQIRGVLCNYCNTGLYLVERDIAWSNKAIAYLANAGWSWGADIRD